MSDIAFVAQVCRESRRCIRGSSVLNVSSLNDAQLVSFNNVFFCAIVFLKQSGAFSEMRARHDKHADFVSITLSMNNALISIRVLASLTVSKTSVYHYRFVLILFFLLLSRISSPPKFVEEASVCEVGSRYITRIF